MTAYYNEIDPKAAAWLHELIKAKAIPDGEVDQRSVDDIPPGDLRGFIQCHFFAGIGGWSEALRLAGWPDDKPVWTGSCPCQPFSSAGQRKGSADERHLWPAWFHLIEQCRPSVVLGEQVDAAIKHGWLDLVQADMEAVDYAFASAVIPAAGIGAPHARHRLWFVAQPGQLPARWGTTPNQAEIGRALGEFAGSSAISGMANSMPSGRTERRAITGRGSASGSGGNGWMEHADMPGQHERTSSGQQPIRNEHHASIRDQRKTNGFWSDADWIPCSDGKWRPIEPGNFPLAHGVQARMDLLRGYGNAIVPQVAAEFITAFLEARELCV